MAPLFDVPPWPDNASKKRKRDRESSMESFVNKLKGKSRPKSRQEISRPKPLKAKGERKRIQSDEDLPQPAKKKVRFEPGGSSSSLTTLQSRMKQDLKGARFRMINETLYKSNSQEALQLVNEEPELYNEYHAGFRHQVQSWPTNPVQSYIAALSDKSCKPGTVLADLGCGDAQLARALSPKGYVVLSFDLVADNPYVVQADVCSKIPLPGSLAGEGQIVDIAVCALSLMAINWPDCIREAWRILKPSGSLKIAEVTSRLTDVSAFIALVSSIGFNLTSKDERNTHFMLFEFKKTARKWKDEEWESISSKASILKPCEYKRR